MTPLTSNIYSHFYPAKEVQNFQGVPHLRLLGSQLGFPELKAQGECRGFATLATINFSSEEKFLKFEQNLQLIKRTFNKLIDNFSFAALQKELSSKWNFSFSKSKDYENITRFFRDLLMIQEASAFPNEFPQDLKPIILSQHHRKYLPTVLEKLKLDLPPSFITWIGNYSEKTLEDQLSELQTLCRSQQLDRCGFTLTIFGHIVFIGYDHKKGWVFAENNNWVEKHEPTKDLKQFSKQLFDALSKEFSFYFDVPPSFEMPMYFEGFSTKSPKNRESLKTFLSSKTAKLSNSSLPSLIVAVLSGDTQRVIDIQESSHINLNTNYTQNCYSPLYVAVQHGHTDIVKYLSSKGAKIDLLNNGYTALFIACQQGHKDIVEYLVSKGAKINRMNEGGAALHIACQNGHKDIVEYLVSKGASINIANKTGHTGLHIACQYGHKDIIDYLMSQRTNINKANAIGLTPLHSACVGGHKNIVEHLILNGAKIDSVTKDGATPLNIASQNGDKELVEYLISKGADLTSSLRFSQRDSQLEVNP